MRKSKADIGQGLFFSFTDRNSIAKLKMFYSISCFANIPRKTNIKSRLIHLKSFAKS